MKLAARCLFAVILLLSIGGNTQGQQFSFRAAAGCLKTLEGAGAVAGPGTFDALRGRALDPNTLTCLGVGGDCPGVIQ